MEKCVVATATVAAVRTDAHRDMGSIFRPKYVSLTRGGCGTRRGSNARVPMLYEAAQESVVAAATVAVVRRCGWGHGVMGILYRVLARMLQTARGRGGGVGRGSRRGESGGDASGRVLQ